MFHTVASAEQSSIVRGIMIEDLVQDTPRLRRSPEMLQVLCDGHLDILGLGVHNDVEHHSLKNARPHTFLTAYTGVP